jgi:hypothetical protein
MMVWKIALYGFCFIFTWIVFWLSRDHVKIVSSDREIKIYEQMIITFFTLELPLFELYTNS